MKLEIKFVEKWKCKIWYEWSIWENLKTHHIIHTHTHTHTYNKLVDCPKILLLAFNFVRKTTSANLELNQYYKLVLGYNVDFLSDN